MMRLRRALGTALISGVAVIAVDAAFKSSLLRTLWPAVEFPPDGAITAPPVVLRWDGPQPLSVALIGDGIREDFGLRESPLEIGAANFPRPGQYRVELRSPLLGRITWSERRFFVQPTLGDAPAGTSPEAPGIETEELRRQIAHMQDAQDASHAETAALKEENTGLQQDKAQLASDLADLREAQEEVDAKLESLENQHAELTRQYRELVDVNRTLQARLQSLPACTAWGYLSYPRPQLIPQARRVIVASNGMGEVFRLQVQCEMARRNDQTAASSCTCLSTPWGG